MPESLFNKVADLSSATLLKRDSNTGTSPLGGLGGVQSPLPPLPDGHATQVFFKMKFSIKDDQIRRKLWIWSHLLKKFLVGNSFFVQCNRSCICVCSVTIAAFVCAFLPPDRVHLTRSLYFLYRSSHQSCSKTKLFLKTSQYSRENTCVGVSF